MNNIFRTLIAGYGAKKLGGGCFSTILIFAVIYYALGVCNKPAQAPVQRTGMHVPTAPAPSNFEPIAERRVGTAVIY